MPNSPSLSMDNLRMIGSFSKLKSRRDLQEIASQFTGWCQGTKNHTARRA